MAFIGRIRELGRLRSALDRPEASVHRVTGIRGGGKSALAARATEGLAAVRHVAPPLPDPDQRAALCARLSRSDEPALAELPPDATWTPIFDALVHATPPGEHVRALVIDDAHRLADARSRWLAPLLGALARAREQRRPLHVVLAGRASGLPTLQDLDELAGESVHLGPLPFRAAAHLLPGSDPTDLLRAYAIFGGVPRALARLDAQASWLTNLRRAVFDDGAPLAEWGLDLLEREVQTPSRYVAILNALARGEADWRHVHESVTDVGGSGQVAPYLNRLEELGLIEVRTSLDAHARARSRRYRVADPLLAFWYRFVLPAHADPDASDREAYVNQVVRPALDAHVATILPAVCRDYMELDAMELLGSNARECGGLWGAGYDVPVAGTLTSGAAFYGLPLWTPPGRRDRPLLLLDDQVRETRYGFGRERRLRILFAGQDLPAHVEREAAKRHDAVVVRAEDLVGGE